MAFSWSTALPIAQYLPAQQAAVTACAAASSYAFQGTASPTTEQLRRMCDQPSCAQVVNALVDASLEETALGFAAVHNAIVPPLFDYCAFFHIPGEPCPSDSYSALVTAFRELNDACASQSGGFSFAALPMDADYSRRSSSEVSSVSAPSSSSSTASESTGASVRGIQALCGIDACDNLMKRLWQKYQFDRVCPWQGPRNSHHVHDKVVVPYMETCKAGWVGWYSSFSGPFPPVPLAPPSTVVSTATPSVPSTPLPLPVPLPVPDATNTNTSSSNISSNVSNGTSDTATPATLASNASISSQPASASDHSGSGSHDLRQGSAVETTPIIAILANGSRSSNTPPASISTPRNDSSVAVGPATGEISSPSSASSATSHTITIMSASMSILAIVVLVIIALVYRKRWQKQRHGHTKDDDSAVAASVYRQLDGTTHSGTSVAATTTTTMIQPHAATVGMVAWLEIPLRDLTEIRVLGGGGHGVVWLVEHVNKTHGTRELLASKRALLPDQEQGGAQLAMDAFVSEIQLMASLTHPRIVAFVGVAGLHRHELQALFEYLPGGDLRQYLDALPEPTNKSSWTHEKLQIAIDIADALAYLHTQKPQPVVHRDLKSRNVFLTQDNRAKLGDFGVSRLESLHGTMTAGVGTSRWVAPEVILGGSSGGGSQGGSGSYGTSCDIYSLGVVLSELDTHRVPFAELDSEDFVIVNRVVTEKITPSFSATCPASILALARRCLSFDPLLRPRASDVATALRGIQQEWGGQ